MIKYRFGKYKGNSDRHHLGTEIAKIFPFERVPILVKKQKDQGIITNKGLAIFAIVAALKVIILFTWR